MKDNAILLLSGGKDSLYCLYQAKKKYKTVICLSFDYGQSNITELEGATAFSDYFDCEHIIMNISDIKNIWDSKMHGNTSAEDYQVVNRNLLFLTIASTLAVKRGVKAVITGVHESDNYYRDCSRVFIEEAKKILALSQGENIEIETPLQGKTVNDIFCELKKEGLFPLVIQHAVTCYNGVPYAKGGCQECYACQVIRGYND